MKVGIGCIPEGISNHPEHTGENAFQQMNTAEVPVEKNPVLPSVFVLSSTLVAKSLLVGFFLNFL